MLIDLQQSFRLAIVRLQDKQLLLKDNVFAISYQGGGGKIVFESRPVEVYAGERLLQMTCKASR